MAKPKFFIVMGQGAAVDLANAAICSGTFVSCCALVAYNPGDTALGRTSLPRGGLFHFPSGALRMKNNKGLVDAIDEWLGFIRPTDLYIVRAYLNQQDATFTSGEDMVDIKNFCATRQTKVHLHPNRGSWIGATVNDGELLIATKSGAAGWPSGDVIDYQRKQEGIYKSGGVSVTLFGESREDSTLDATG